MQSLDEIAKTIKKEKNFLNTYNPYVPKDHNYLILKNYNRVITSINSEGKFKFNATKYVFSKKIAEDPHFHNEIKMIYDSLLQNIEEYKTSTHEKSPGEITGYSSYDIGGTDEDGIVAILDKFVKINHIVNNPYGYLINEVNKTNNYNNSDQSKLLLDHCKAQLIKKIMIQSMKASTDMATLIATVIFKIGVFFPPAIIIVSTIAIAIVGSGLVLGAVAGLVQRIRLNKAINNVLLTTRPDNSLQNAINSKLKDINNKKENLAFSRVHNAFSIGVVLSAIAGFTKYFLLPVMQSAMSIGMSAVNAIKNIFDIFKNYKDRQNNLQNIPAFMRKMIDQQHFSVTKKRYIFFGKSELDKYKKKYQQIISQQNKNIKDNSVNLSADDVFLFSLSSKFAKYKQKHNADNNIDSVLFGKFMQESLLNNMSKDLLINSALSTLQLTLCLGGGLFVLFPPAGIGIAASLIVSSLIVTPIIRFLEKRKLLKKFQEQSEIISDYTNKIFNQMINRKDYIDLLLPNTESFNKKSNVFTKVANGLKKPLLFNNVHSVIKKIKKKKPSNHQEKHNHNTVK